MANTGTTLNRAIAASGVALFDKLLELAIVNRIYSVASEVGIRSGMNACQWEMQRTIAANTALRNFVESNFSNLADEVAALTVLDVGGYLLALPSALKTALSTTAEPSVFVNNVVSISEATDTQDTHTISVNITFSVGIDFQRGEYRWTGGNSDAAFTRAKILTAASWTAAS